MLDDAGINYLIPVDVKSAEDTELWDQSLRLTEVTRKLKGEAGNATHFVVFDACRNNLKLKTAGSRALVQAKGFVPVVQESGMLIAYATAEGELASDVGAGAGPYAKALAEEIIKPGIEAVAMFRVVQRRVRAAIRQEPYLGFNALGDVYLAGVQAEPVKPKPPAPARLSEAAEAWDRTKDTASVTVLEAFIAQFYDDKLPPKLVLLSHDIQGRRLLGEALSLRSGHKITVMPPVRGEKRELVDHALINAREALARRLAESSSQAAILARLAELFDLDESPERIEVYDNSHISGSNPVGAMIVSGPEGFIKGQYRKFNMKSEDLAPGDDYAMMREMLTRRFKKLAKEKDGLNGWAAPDLVLIDGGPGQLGAAHAVLDELGLSEIKVAAMAKGPDRNAGRERIYLRGKEPLLLEPRDPVLYCLQTLRDEAHRFAIGAHRAKRKKAITASPLDEVPGIGPSRKRALLQHFGSAKAVSRAGVADLESVGGISAQMARAIYDYFHERG
jgi:hypothetical protein